MVYAIISAVVEELTSLMPSTIKEEVKLVTGVDHEVDELVSRFRSVRAVLDEAEKQQVKNACVQNWLFSLKTVAYDMDDLLDKWNTRIQISQLQRQHHSSDPIAPKYKPIKFSINESDSTNESDKLIVTPTTSVVGTLKVEGRDDEKDQVKRKIREAKYNPHIISLVGLGGIGKTTLAKLIYNDSEMQTRFEKMIWVCVSEPFDQMRIAKAILESLRSSSSTLDLKELNNVVKEIREILDKKRFLLVLDDVWNEDGSKWKELKQSLTCGLLGSTILITTRSKTVATVMGCNLKNIHNLRILTKEECWSIIREVTLVQGDVQDDGQRLESIGRRIAEKCKGLPLVANTVGGILSGLLDSENELNSENEWLSVLKKEEWKGDGALNPLKLSYYYLPLPLKPCFKYCAIFPKDSQHNKKILIRMWMAQGYLRGEKGKKDDLEINGEKYFKNLMARFLLLTASNDLDGRWPMLRIAAREDDDVWFILHDMVSDLAQTFAKDECLMIQVSNGTKFNENSLHSNANVRHLTLMIEKDASFPVFTYGPNKLRSLIIQFLHGSCQFRDGSSLTVDALKNIFEYFTCLRTLDLTTCDIKEVPSSIGGLVHLKLLDLSFNKKLGKLPETLCECYNLQTLILIGCYSLFKLPQGIGKLINLIFLNIRMCLSIKYLPTGIGNLLHLKELRDFIIGVYQKERFCIDEMEKLDNLRGKLMIKGLGNVREIEEAKKAQLMKKKEVIELELLFDTEWGFFSDRDPVHQEKLLEALEPPSDLKILKLGAYKGKVLFPNWMMKLKLLRRLEINLCRHCKKLPPLGKLPCLEELYLCMMEVVKKVGVEFMGIEEEKDPSTPFHSFPKLKILEFDRFNEWKKWDDIDGWLMERITNQTFAHT